MTEQQTFIKLKGQKFALCAINLDRSTPNWLKFDRVNTKTGQVTAKMEVNTNEVESIETRS